MSTDTAFRTKSESTPQKESLPEGKETTSGSIDTGVEVPYRDYKSAHGQPYLADYFQLGDTWNDTQGGFPEEIAKLEGYINDKIDSGEVANSVSAIKDLIKGMEKFNNLTKEERSVVKIEVLANYVEFLEKNDEVKKNLRRYSNA